VSRAGRRRGLLLAVALGAGAGLLGGCGTCRPDQPPVQPRAGGSVGVESGTGWWSDVGVALDLSNLFCKPPPPATERQPGPGSEPIPDVPEQQSPAPPASPASPPPPAPSGP
jgi:hypothetical protein